MFPKQQQFILEMCFALVAIVNGSIAVIHMIFKELCSVVDKVLMLYNILIACFLIAAAPLLITRYLTSLKLLAFCMAGM